MQLMLKAKVSCQICQQKKVFTAPDFRRADGYVTSTKPLSYNGNIIEGIKVTFENGQIVDITAEKGDQVMKDLVFKNAGARRLGECALVPDPSQFLSQALLSLTPFSMRMRQTTWLSVQPMRLASLVVQR